MTAVLILALMGGVLWFLFQLKKRDIADCATVLALAPAAAQTTKGTTPEGFAYTQRLLLNGVLLGHPAALYERTVRHPTWARHKRRSSQFTVLEFSITPPVSASIRLQPEGTLGWVEQLVRGRADDRVTIEPTFDTAFATYAADPALARSILTPLLRERLLAFRAATADLPSSIAGRMASGLVLGTFHIDGSTARYALFGSPIKSTAEQVKAAAPVLLELAEATRRSASASA